jgi:hypothetical protein
MTTRMKVNCYSHDSTISILPINISVIIIDEDRCFDLFFNVPLIEHHTAHERGFLLRARFPYSSVYISDERGLSLFTRFPCSFLLPLQREFFVFSKVYTSPSFYLDHGNLERQNVVSQDPRLSSHERDVNLVDTDPGQRHRHRHTRYRPGHMSTTLL